MKALSLRQPWAWLVVNGHKDIENRTWPIPRTMGLPQRVYIHAAKTLVTKVQALDMPWIKERLDPSIFEAMMQEPWPRGAIVGEVTITACLMVWPHSRWFAGPFGYHLEDAQAYEAPIPYVGMLGFFNVTDIQLWDAEHLSGSPPATH